LTPLIDTVTRAAVDANPRTIGDQPRPLSRPNDAGDAVLARDDRRVGEQPACVGHDGAEQRKQDVECLGRRPGDEHVSLDDAVELRGPCDETRRALVDAGAGREPAHEPVLVLGL
jgi:hypothetical protein